MQITSRTTLAESAAAYAGNWRKMDCFIWTGETEWEQPENVCLAYVSNRDSGLLDQSNAAAIAERMKPFTDPAKGEPTARAETHSHWACGYIDGYSILVYGRKGKITPAFAEWFKIQQELADYPVLDESDWSERESAATWENLKDAVRDAGANNLDESQLSDVYEWLSDNSQCALESRDDQGGYPSPEELRPAFDALGIKWELSPWEKQRAQA